MDGAGRLMAAMDGADIEELACLQLSADPLFEKLGAAEAAGIVRRALAAGRDAVGLLGPEAEKGPKAVLAGLDVPVKRAEGCARGVHLAALTRQAADGRIEVTLFEDELAWKAGMLAAAGAPDFEPAPTKEELEELTLWHELFHVLDFARDGALSASASTAEVPGLFGRRRRHVATAQELCAHSFAYRAVHGRWNPWKADLVLLSAAGDMGTPELEDRLAHARRLLKEKEDS